MAATKPKGPAFLRAALSLLLAWSLASFPGVTPAWADEREAAGLAAAAQTAAAANEDAVAVLKTAAAAGEDPNLALARYAQQLSDDKAAGAPLANAMMPTRYYLTNLGQVTSVKFQNPWGSCWAFAAIAALESSVLKAQGAPADDGMFWSDSGSVEPQITGLTNAVDYSEHALAWFAHERQTEALAGAQAGEGMIRQKTTLGTQMAGAAPWNAETEFTSGLSMAAEGDVPYTYLTASGEPYVPDAQKGDLPWWNMVPNPDGSTPEEPIAGSADARLQDWSVDASLRALAEVEVTGSMALPSPVKTSTTVEDGVSKTEYLGYDEAATEAIKQALVDVGGVSIAFMADQSKPGSGSIVQGGSGEHFSYDNWCQYNGVDLGSDHGVTIVGWDDDYPAANFTGTASGQPEGDGAWLVKNSWGSDAFFDALGYPDDKKNWGLEDADGNHSGFFWLSYYDHSISSPYAYEVSPNGGYQHRYQHDYLGIAGSPTQTVAPGDDVRFANVFTAQGDELLRAVSARTFSPGETAEVWVYVLNADARHPTDGTLAAPAQSAAFEHAGYHEIVLDQPVQLAAGQRFAVVERVRGVTADGSPGGYLNLEYCFDASLVAQISSAAMVGQAVANDGETFATTDGKEWFTPAEYEDAVTEVQGGTALMHYGNAMIKAFTDDDPNPAPKPVDPVPVDPSPGGDPQQPGALEPERVDFGHAEAKPLSKTGDAATPAASAAAALALGALALAAVATFALRRRRKG